MFTQAAEGGGVRVFVSGSHGLIGSALVEALASRGDEVTPIARAGERLDLGGLENADVVVHLAGAGLGEQRWNEERKRVLLESREQPTRQVAEALAALAGDGRPRVLVSASAIGFYGDRGDQVLTEASDGGTGFLAEVCRRWEDATAPAADAGVRVVRLRSGVVLSSRGGALKPLLLPFKLGLGGRIGSGKQWFSWIALEDEVRAILHVIDTGDIRGPVNATAPNPVTNAEYSRTLASVLHRPALIPTPTFAVATKIGREGAQEMVLTGQRVLPAVLQTSGFTFVHPDLRGALAAELRHS